MKQFKVMAAVAVAGLTMLASCAKDNDKLQNDGTTSVGIQLLYDQGNTRAPGAAVSGTLTATNGHIFFADAAGTINTHVGVGNTAGNVQISLSDLTTGEAVITGVSSQATKCYILMNDANAKIGTATGITTSLKGMNIETAVQLLSITVNNINDATGAVANVPLYGSGDVAPATGTTTGLKPYTAKVKVQMNALASRFQIGKITGVTKTYTDASSVVHNVTIDDFTVEGIYINNFQSTYTIKNGGTSVIDGSNVPAAYSTTTGTTSYTSGGVGEKLADYVNTAASSGSVTPTLAYWAYNVFPSTTVPHIIIKLSEVKYTDDANNVQQTVTDQFLTVSSFKYSASHSEPALQGQPVTSFLVSNVYTLGEIKFDYTHLTTVPYDTPMDVLAEVEMMSWVQNPIDWNN